MPDYYRLYDQLRGASARLSYIPERLRQWPGKLLEVPGRLRAAPAEMRRWRTPGGFPVKQTVLGVTTLALAVAAGGRGNSPAAHKPARGWFGASRSTTPADVQGRWVTATSGATHYWSHDTGVFQGSGHGSSQIYEFDAEGGYRYYIYMEVRTNFSYVQMNNKCAGTAEFKGDRVTFHTDSGHFDATGTSYVNRDMTPEERATWSKTYRWRRENGADGQPRFFLESDNTAKPETTEFKVLTY